MSEPQFEPGGFFDFDLSQGTVESRDGSRVVVVSEAVMAPLVSAAIARGDLKALRQLGRYLGSLAGTSLTAGSSASPRDMSTESVAGHAASVLGIFGWGQLRLERWGAVLVAHLDGGLALDSNELGAAALLGGLFSHLGDAEVASVPLGGGTFVLVSPTVAEKVWGMARKGDSLVGIAEALQAGA